MHGRGGGGGGGPFDPAATRPLDYHVEDIPLSVLAGHRTAPRGPNFRTMKPHAVLDAKGKDLEFVDDHSCVVPVLALFPVS